MKINRLIIILLFIQFSLQAQIEHLEPPFWWTGMNSSELQILVHGEMVSESKVEIDYQGVELKSVARIENPNYIFLNLELSEDLKPGSFPIKFTSNRKLLSVYEYHLHPREKNSKNREGFNSSDVIYLLMPDRFANGDSSNDIDQNMLETVLDRGDPYGRHGGDIKGIRDNLDYFEKMGFTALWLNPLLENNQPEASYHGYATTDFYKVDSRYGTNEDYKKLTQLASEKGIKMVMDMIFNHCGSEHWWMKDLPSKDWINYSDDYKITNHRRTVNQDPYASDEDIELMRDGWFVPTMPDLNGRNPFLATYLIQNSIWWIEYSGIAGIRMDTYPYPDKFMMADWCKRILEEYPDFNMVGEEWSTNPLTVSYWQKGKNNADGYEPNLPSVFDFPLQHAVTEGLKEPESWGTGLIKIYEALSNDYIYPDPNNLVIFPDNHDMSRFYMQLGMDQKLYKLGITYFLTMRGIPQIYYGSEILMTHTEGNDHGLIRKDFPGGWDGDKTNAFTGENLGKDEKEMQDFFSLLLNWRKENPVIHDGKLTHFAPVDGVYVYFRYNESKKVMVILNKNKKTCSLRMDRFSGMLGKARTGYDIISKEELNVSSELKLKAQTPYILELN